MPRISGLIPAILLAFPVVGFGQQSSAPSSQPAAKGEFKLRVLELKGRAYRGGANADPKSDGDWTALKIGDELGAGDQLHTSLRTTVKLVLEPATPPTIILVDRVSLISIDELTKARNAGGLDAVVTRLGLAYGTVRAGVAEGDVRSDMVIQSPVATLAKRGTWGFSFYVERGTGRFEMYLADRGVVEAIQFASKLHRQILPGQSVNQFMARWVDTARFTRPVTIQDWHGLKGDELSFLLGNQTGLAILAPGSNPIAILNMSGRQSQDLTGRFNFGNGGFSLQDLFKGGLQGFGGFNTGLGLNGLSLNFSQFQPRHLPEGDFGVGTGGLPAFGQTQGLGAKNVVKRLQSGRHR